MFDIDKKIKLHYQIQYLAISMILNAYYINALESINLAHVEQVKFIELTIPDNIAQKIAHLPKVLGEEENYQNSYREVYSFIENDKKILGYNLV